MELITKFEPAFDRRSMGMDFNGVTLRMIVKGELGCVHFVLFTNWHLDNIALLINQNKKLTAPKPVEVGYYSLYRPLYEKQPKTDFCPYLDHAECYYDGIEREGIEAFAILREQGDAGVWRFLILKYEERFKRGVII